jgi:hypothetical protein
MPHCGQKPAPRFTSAPHAEHLSLNPNNVLKKLMTQYLGKRETEDKTVPDGKNNSEH